MSTFEGRVWKFGDDVNTDLIIPGRYLHRYDSEHLAAHAMEGANKAFASEVRQGDIIVAGRNFGCGSSREQAAIAIKAAGISAVLAKSFARIFYRNAVNLGLNVLVSENASDVFEDGDTATLDIIAGVLTSSDSSKKATAEKVPDHVLAILRAGGLVPCLKDRLEKS
jgi:3-isopropylmalate dehydratase small subunit